MANLKCNSIGKNCFLNNTTTTTTVKKVTILWWRTNRPPTSMAYMVIGIKTRHFLHITIDPFATLADNLARFTLLYNKCGRTGRWRTSPKKSIKQLDSDANQSNVGIHWWYQLKLNITIVCFGNVSIHLSLLLTFWCCGRRRHCRIESNWWLETSKCSFRWF